MQPALAVRSGTSAPQRGPWPCKAARSCGQAARPPRTPPPRPCTNQLLHAGGLSGWTAKDCAYLDVAAVRHSYASSGCCARTNRAMSVSATAQLSAQGEGRQRKGALCRRGPVAAQERVAVAAAQRAAAQQPRAMPGALAGRLQAAAAQPAPERPASRPAGNCTRQKWGRQAPGALTQRRGVPPSLQAGCLHVHLGSLVQQGQLVCRLRRQLAGQLLRVVGGGREPTPTWVDWSNLNGHTAHRLSPPACSNPGNLPRCTPQLTGQAASSTHLQAQPVAVDRIKVLGLVDRLD